IGPPNACHPGQRPAVLPRILAHRRPSGRLSRRRDSMAGILRLFILIRGLMAMSFVRRSLLWWGLAALLILGAWVWWSGRPTQALDAHQAGPAPVLVHTAQVEARDVPIRLRGLGSIQAWASVMVRARIDGRLESVGFQEGEVVQQGQLIAQLDDRVQKAQLAQAVAQKARDQAQLDNTRADLNRYIELRSEE